mmetsp:Transcript_16728/g.32519  ORF Transcript_16728/g.32519 Transcript_16728/m.32519 type:complete len:335 (-) Transcript_16728:444-1448(-)|eukprot:CAMPEP_0171501552 /NCGR_PEP_ID=MMETSP0958-20121227/9626_1 /TAXON_ID=87120 /ORGANISM="Aurantiochytrium limacinum, Strain ATCCMYA-1381" /LENGTH=334 /DNA_ID=CAMNT_0012036389 /DNA_START=283 /DNA_END=1287 /DNA_ORIENTATION=+
MTLNLEDFDLGVTLGTGSFGRVRFATYKSNPQVSCAIKMLKKNEVVRLQQVDHMLQEKSILESISKGSDGLSRHPFIVNLFATFQDECFLYMVLEYVNGGEFFTHLRRVGQLDNNAAKFYAATVTLIFEHLHSDDIIYRDLKPENLLLDHQGFMKITDFGFAKKVLFKTYTLCGTPEYISPETLLNKGHGKGVDWWTLGILIFEMLAGQPPFVDDDPMGIYQQILGGNVNFPRYFDRQAKNLIKKLLTADLTKRYGCLKRGAVDIKEHKWLSGLNFENLLARKMEPPIKPKVSGPCDTTNFDPYPDTMTKPERFVSNADPFEGFSTVVSDPTSE